MAGGDMNVSVDVTVELNEYDRALLENFVDKVQGIPNPGLPLAPEERQGLTESDIERIAAAVVQKILPLLPRREVPINPYPWVPPTRAPWQSPVWASTETGDPDSRVEVWNG